MLLTAGQTLDIPSANSNANRFDTFSPGSAIQEIGSTTPGLPYIPAPPEAGCNVLAMIIVVAVTIYTGGAATQALSGTFLGATGAAAAGAAVGSAAGQVAGMALGVQDSFDLGQVAVAALTAGVARGLGDKLANTATFGEVAEASETAANAAQTASVASTASQAVQYTGNLNAFGRAVVGAAGVITGAAANKVISGTSNFSWASVAGAAVGAAAGGALPGEYAKIDSFEAFAANAGISLLASGASHITQKALGGHGTFNFANVAADAFGNALGNSIVTAQTNNQKPGGTAGLNSGGNLSEEAYADYIRNELGVDIVPGDQLDALPYEQWRANELARTQTVPAERYYDGAWNVGDFNLIDSVTSPEKAALDRFLLEPLLSSVSSGYRRPNDYINFFANKPFAANTVDLYGNSTLRNGGQPGPWRDGYNFTGVSDSTSQLAQAGFFKDILDVAGTVGTGLTSGFLVSNLPLGGIELSSQKLLFNTADTIVGYTDEFGRLTQTATTGLLGASSVFTELNSPTFSVLGAGENVANGNLGIAFNGNGVAGKFNGLTIADTLDTLGKGVFFTQTAMQGVQLGGSLYSDFESSGFALNSISNETIDLAGQTALDVTFGAISTFGGPVGATIGLGYTFREPLFDASKTSFENQVKEHQFNLNNNLPPRIGPKF